MIRPMVLSDVMRVAEIHVCGWRSAYRGIVSDEFLFNEMLVARRMVVFSQSFYDVGRHTYVYDDGIIKAFMTIGPCRDADKPESFELWGLYVDPWMQRQGVGAQLVVYCLDQATAGGYADVYLWVLEQNENARRFYETKGFRADGTRKYLAGLGAYEIRYELIL